MKDEIVRTIGQPEDFEIQVEGLNFFYNNESQLNIYMYDKEGKIFIIRLEQEKHLKMQQIIQQKNCIKGLLIPNVFEIWI